MTSAFEISSRYVDEYCDLFPVAATYLGVPGRDGEWGDGGGLAAVEEAHALQQSFRTKLEPFLDDPDPRQALAAAVAVASADEHDESFRAGDHFKTVRHMASGFHRLRSVFDVMPTETEDDWADIVSRLETIDKPVADYQNLLREGISRGLVNARRQVDSLASQAEALAGDASSFLDILGKAESAGHMSERLRSAVDHARAQAAAFADFLRTEYLPAASVEDASGPEEYQRAADRLVGIDIDPDEAYEWGWEEFHRLLSEMQKIGELIVPGGTFGEVKDFLETDPDGLAHSTDELVQFVKRILEEAVEDLAGTHFDVPDIIRPLTVQIAPPGGPLGVYYMGPSEDFSRPGGVWYAIGDQNEFPLYQHRSTAYHEGFPGHHLQIATARYHGENLSRFQRLLTWYPGYGEGWGMYAEVLMGELGYLESPKSYFGMLAKQMYRAARIVVDIGLHLGKTVADSSPIGAGDVWTFEAAVEFMKVYGFRTPAQAEAEVLRYLGWPGQAIAYKLGEREILSIRKETQDRLGDGFDLAAFHAVVLENGSMRLDMLRDVVRDRLPS